MISLSSRLKSAPFRRIYPRKIVRDCYFLNFHFFGRFAARASRRYGHILWQTANCDRTAGRPVTRSTSQYKSICDLQDYLEEQKRTRTSTRTVIRTTVQSDSTVPVLVRAKSLHTVVATYRKQYYLQVLYRTGSLVPPPAAQNPDPSSREQVLRAIKNQNAMTYMQRHRGPCRIHL